MTLVYGIDINIWILLVAILFIFIGGIMLNWVNKTIGLSFAFKLFKIKTRKLGKSKILLKVFVPNGVPQWKIVDIAPRINYKYTENGKTKEGLVIFNYYCMYEMFNGIKVLECMPYDVFPRNPYVNTSLTISGDVFKKNAVDSAKEDFQMENFKKWAKIGLPLLIAFGVILILYSQGQSDALQVCYDEVQQLARQMASSKPTPIIAS